MTYVPQPAGFWDNIARTKTFTHPLRLDRFAPRVPSSARILDCGCGHGRTLNELHAHGYANVVGLDPSPEMVARAREGFPNRGLVVGEGATMPFADQTFDAVLLFAVLTCVPEDHGQQRIMDAVFRILRPDGVVYISDYLIQDDPRNVERYQRSLGVCGTYGVFRAADGSIFRHHDPAWIAELTCRFTPLALYTVNVTTMNGNPAKAFQFLGRR